MRILLHLFQGFLEIFTRKRLSPSPSRAFAAETLYSKINNFFPQFEIVAVSTNRRRLGDYILLPDNTYTVFPHRWYYNL